MTVFKLRDTSNGHFCVNKQRLMWTFAKFKQRNKETRKQRNKEAKRQRNKEAQKQRNIETMKSRYKET